MLRTPSLALKAAADPSYAETTTAIDRRVAPRHQASLVPSITGLRLSPCGGDALLVNISAMGALVKCSTRVLPGTAVVVVFEGTLSPSSIKSRVARCLVADIDADGILWYYVGVTFDKPITLDSSAVLASPSACAPEAPPVPTALRNRW